jgi:thymidylate synthase
MSGCGRILEAQTVNDAVFQLCQQLAEVKAGAYYGSKTASRYGDCYELLNVSVDIENPRNRHTWLIGRKNNIYATIAEALWVLAGQENIEPYLSFFVPRAQQFSDNGKTWHDAYGPRIYDSHQLEHVLDIFQLEGVLTRRAVITLWNPNKDTVQALSRQLILNSRKAVPCNNVIYFYARNNELCCHVIQRSSDIVWGLSNVNLFEFTLLHEIVLCALKKKQVANVVANANENRLRLRAFFTGGIDIGKLDTEANIKDFFWAIHRYYLHLLWRGGIKYLNVIGCTAGCLEAVFCQYEVPVDNNMLYVYCKAVDMYIKTKCGLPLDAKDYVLRDRIIDVVAEDFLCALQASKFTPDHRYWKDMLGDATRVAHLQ